MDNPSNLTVHNRVSRVLSVWRQTHCPDARGFLAENPDVKSSHSLVIDLAYEEYCLRQEQGERLDTAQFCRQFPTVQRSLERMLDVHRVLASQSLSARSFLPDAWPEAGERWLDWHLLEPLGRGAFSRVFLARDEALGHREVVVKCCVSGPREAFILGGFSHPNIVPIHSVQHDDPSGLTAICMPLVGRVTLAEMIDRHRTQHLGYRELMMLVRDKKHDSSHSLQRLSEQESILCLVEGVAAGLAVAHKKGVVHGDIKPSNILLAFDGTPMLLDFNLAMGPAGMGDRLGGTPPYIAPERLGQLFAASPPTPGGVVLDPRSDVFSLGVVLLELLGGKLPSAAAQASLASPAEKDWDAIIRDTRVNGPPIDAQLERIVRRCLATDPTTRYTTASELAGDLRTRLASFDRRRRRTKAALAAVSSGVLACLLFLGASWLPWPAPQTPRALVSRALQTQHTSDFIEAAHALQKEFKQNPSGDLAAWIGYLFAAGDSWESASPYFKYALEAHPESAILLNDLGVCNARCGKFQEALQHLNGAVDLDEELQAAHHNLGELHTRFALREQRPPSTEAFKALEEALRIGPESAKLHFDMAVAIACSQHYGQPSGRDLAVHLREAARVESFKDPIRNSELLKPYAHDALSGNFTVAGRKPLPEESPLLLPPPFDLPNLADRPLQLVSARKTAN